MPSGGQWIFIGIGGIVVLFIIFLTVMYFMRTSHECDTEAAKLAMAYYQKNNIQKLVPTYLDIRTFLATKGDDKKTCDVRFSTAPGRDSKMNVSGFDHRRFDFELNKDGKWYVSNMGDYHSGKKFD